MNIVILIGRLVRDPEYKMTQSGKALTTFTVAVDRSYAKDKADYIDCQAWGSTADFIYRYFSQGKRISLQGEIQTETWTDKDNKTRKATRVNVGNVEFVGGKDKTPSKPRTVDKEAFSGFEDVDTADGDLPF